MSNLLKRARSDIQIAKTLLSPVGNPASDEMITDQAAYHIQQGIEKALKYQTEISGVPYKKIRIRETQKKLLDRSLKRTIIAADDATIHGKEMFREGGKG